MSIHLSVKISNGSTILTNASHNVDILNPSDDEVLSDTLVFTNHHDTLLIQDFMTDSTVIELELNALDNGDYSVTFGQPDHHFYEEVFINIEEYVNLRHAFDDITEKLSVEAVYTLFNTMKTILNDDDINPDIGFSVDVLKKDKLL